MSCLMRRICSMKYTTNTPNAKWKLNLNLKPVEAVLTRYQISSNLLLFPLTRNLDQGWNKFSKNASDVGAGIGSRLSSEVSQKLPSTL